LVEGGGELERDVVLRGGEQQELADEEEVEQEDQDEEEADDPSVEPTLAVASPVAIYPFVPLLLLQIKESRDLADGGVVQAHVLQEASDVAELLQNVDSGEGSAEGQDLELSLGVELLEGDDQEGDDHTDNYAQQN